MDSDAVALEKSVFKFITSSCKNTKSSTDISPNRKTDWTAVKSRSGGRP